MGSPVLDFARTPICGARSTDGGVASLARRVRAGVLAWSFGERSEAFSHHHRSLKSPLSQAKRSAIPVNHASHGVERRQSARTPWRNRAYGPDFALYKIVQTPIDSVAGRSFLFLRKMGNFSCGRVGSTVGLSPTSRGSPHARRFGKENRSVSSIREDSTDESAPQGGSAAGGGRSSQEQVWLRKSTTTH